MPCAAGPYLAWISRASPLNLPLHLSYQVRERRDPLCSLARSDSSNLDAVFEHLRRTNPDIEPAMAIGCLVPEAYRDQPDYDNNQEAREITLTLTPNPSPNPTPSPSPSPTPNPSPSP